MMLMAIHRVQIRDHPAQVARTLQIISSVSATVGLTPGKAGIKIGIKSGKTRARREASEANVAGGTNPAVVHLTATRGRSPPSITVPTH